MSHAMDSPWRRDTIALADSALLAGTLLLAAPFFSASAAAEPVLVGAFSTAPAEAGLPADWRLVRLPGIAPTEFSLVDDAGTRVVRLDADSAAASLVRPLRVDPAAYPLLRWRWRVDNLIEGADYRLKDGDDFPARLYVMFDYPPNRLSLFDRGKIELARRLAGVEVPAAALCYVWDKDARVGTSVWSPYTDRVRIIVLRSGASSVGRWASEQRDLARDFRDAFGEDAPMISGIAIAADTDQTGAQATAWIGDIELNTRPGTSQSGAPPSPLHAE